MPRRNGKGNANLRGKAAQRKVQIPREVRQWIEESSLYVGGGVRSDGRDGARRGRKTGDLG